LISKSKINTLENSININFKQVCEKKQIEAKYQNLYTVKNDILKIITNYKRSIYNDMSIYNEIDFELEEKLNQIYLQTLNHINDIRSKVLYNDNHSDDIYKNIKKVEIQCNKDLQRVYENVVNRIDSENSHTRNINVCISKSRSIKDIKKLLDEEIKFMKIEVKNIKDINFTKKYVKYFIVKDHIKYLSNIEDILINLG